MHILDTFHAGGKSYNIALNESREFQVLDGFYPIGRAMPSVEDALALFVPASDAALDHDTLKDELRDVERKIMNLEDEADDLRKKLKQVARSNQTDFIAGIRHQIELLAA